jgi:hypothetical protein
VAQNLNPTRLKYASVSSRAFFAAIQEFYTRPTRDTAVSALRAMAYADAKKCQCVVSDWRSTFVRQTDRWVENTGPSGLCGVIKVLTLVPRSREDDERATGAGVVDAS